MCPVLEKTLLPYESQSLPIPSSSFIGREDDIHNITKVLDFDHSSVQILSIYGPPAIGKSTLAIHIGHKLAAVGIHAHYVNMAEIPDVQALYVRIFSSAGIIDTTSKISESDAKNNLRDWTRKLESNTLLILDNCDPHLSDPVRKDPFQDTIEDLPRYSTAIKLLITSQNTTALLGNFELYRLTYLSRKDAFELFRNLTNISKETQIAQVYDVIGGVPLALKLIATQLKQKHSICESDIECVIAKLKSKPLELLSAEEFSTKNTVRASINIAYEPIREEYQKCGQYLAIFPGSFTEAAAASILPQEPSVVRQCLEILVKCSLLEWHRPYNNSVKRYLIHTLIKEFLKAQQLQPEDVLTFNAKYVMYYADFLKHSYTPMYVYTLI